MGDLTVSKFPYSDGILGLHLVLDKPTAPSPEERIGRPFLARGVPLTDWQLRSTLQGREQAIDRTQKVIDTMAPGFSPAKRREWATQLADALIDQSTSALLSREAPTALERVEQRDQALQNLFRNPPAQSSQGSLESMAAQIPLGVTVTVHF